MLGVGAVGKYGPRAPGPPAAPGASRANARGRILTQNAEIDRLLELPAMQGLVGRTLKTYFCSGSNLEHNGWKDACIALGFRLRRDAWDYFLDACLVKLWKAALQDYRSEA